MQLKHNMFIGHGVCLLLALLTLQINELSNWFTAHQLKGNSFWYGGPFNYCQLYDSHFEGGHLWIGLPCYGAVEIITLVLLLLLLF